jgi:hypothetical protein
MERFAIDRLSVSDYYGGSTRPWPPSPPLIRTRYIWTKLTQVLDKIETRSSSRTPH